MRTARLVTLLFFLLLQALALPAGAQYFGKNKITYQDFDWYVYESPHFDVHYYPEVEPFLEEIVSRFGLEITSGESKPGMLRRLERSLADRCQGGGHVPELHRAVSACGHQKRTVRAERHEGHLG